MKANNMYLQNLTNLLVLRRNPFDQDTQHPFSFPSPSHFPEYLSSALLDPLVVKLDHSEVLTYQMFLCVQTTQSYSKSLANQNFL